MGHSYNRSHWCEEEFRSLDLGDERLTRRLLSVAKDLSNQPLEPINQACESPGGVKAAYRLFANEKTQSEPILQAHQQETFKRAAKERRIFAIQDTSFIDYTSHIRTRGLGKISTYLGGMNNGRGLVVHTTLALAENGLPLGLLDQQIWARPPKPKCESPVELTKNCGITPIEKKESFKWLKGIRRCVNNLRTIEAEENKSEPIQVISIADQEADIFEFMEEIKNLGTHFVIRAHHVQDRVLMPEVGPTRHHNGVALHTLWKDLPKQSVQGLLKVEVPRKAPNTKSSEIPSRIARTEIRFCPIRLALPRRASIRHRKASDRYLTQAERQKQTFTRTLQVYAIWIREIHPPKNTEAIEWLLLTTLPVRTMKEAKEKINWYKLRWRIESFHKILKSGCRVEDCRLNTADRLKKYLTLFSIIAWRILWMTLLNRRDPNQTCETVLTTIEWQALYCSIHRSRMFPRSPPTIHQTIRWIARLGGFLGRKCDREPGMETIWRGWQRLNDISRTWELLRVT